MARRKWLQVLGLALLAALLSLAAAACGSDPTAAPTNTPAPTPTTAPAAPQSAAPANTPAPAAQQQQAANAPAPTNTPAPAPTDTPAAMPEEPEEVFELKFTSPLSPPPFLMSEVHKWWADEVSARSNGRIVWDEFFWSGALTKPGETLEAVEAGLADVGQVVYPYYPGKLPLGNWTYAVPFGPGDPKLILEAALRVFDEVPALLEEVEGYNLKFLLPAVIDTYNLTSKEPIITFEDFDGIKIASIGSYHPRILEGAGATAIAMPVGDRYQALQTGVIEAEFLPWDISHSYKYTDFNKHITWVDMGAAMPIALGVNRDLWDSLPADLQQIMIEVAEEATVRNANLILERRNAALEEWGAEGITRHEMPFEEKQKWAEALSDIPGEWIEENGATGEAVMVAYLNILEELGHEFPRNWAADYR